MFINSWADIGRTIIMAVLAYSGLVVILRVSGKRTLSKMNAFDLVVTVALGSCLATIILSRDVALAEGLAALATLVLLQFIVAWLSVRVPMVNRLVKSEPAMLLYQGEYLHSALRTERVTEEEVRSAVRAQGIAELQGVLAVVLETDGTFTVLPSTEDPQVPVLQGVTGADRVRDK